MSVGLIALLDDLAAIAKVAAASHDDVASQAADGIYGIAFFIYRGEVTHFKICGRLDAHQFLDAGKAGT